MELLIILIITIIVLCFSGMSIIKMIKNDAEFNNKLLVFTLFLYTFLVFFCLLYNLNKPKAIDVYKGKTTLEITYKDRVPIDSTVVWKNK